MRLQRVAGLIGAGILAVHFSKTADAQSAPTNPDTRIQAIESQINALQGQLQQLKSDLVNTNQQLQQSQQQTKQAQDVAKQAQDQATKTAASVPLVTFPNGRPTISTPDKKASLAIGMQMQFDMGGYFQNQHNSNDVLPTATQDLNNGSNLRRGRIFIVGKYEDWTANLTPDFGGSPDGTVSLYEANLNYTGIKSVTATLGYFKPWYSLQDSMSSNDFLFMERPSIVEISRNVAAGDARASFGAKSSTDDYFASAYLTGGTWGDQNAALTNDEQLGAVMRLATRPFHGDDWNTHIGFSGSVVFNPASSNGGHGAGTTSSTIQLRDRPELRIDMNRLIDTGTIEADGADTWGFEAGGNWHNFLLQGEYIRIDVDPSHGSNLHFQGGYVEGSWVLTGESHKYNTSAAAYARPTPLHPFNPFTGEDGWGAWEVSARYSLTDLNSEDIDGGNQKVYSAGLSWYPTSLIRFMLQTSYVDVDRHSGGHEVGQDFWDVALRSQIAF